MRILSLISLIAVIGIAACIFTQCKTKPTDTTTTSNALDSLGLYTASCSGCHGAKGTGGSGILSNFTIQHLTRDSIVGVAETGRGRMPSFKGVLGVDTIAVIAQYIMNNFQPQASTNNTQVVAQSDSSVVK